jgi:hypothetical protein
MFLFEGATISAKSILSEPMTGNDNPVIDTADHTIPDTTEVAGDTIKSDSVTLDPILYQPEGDTLLLGVYQSRQATDNAKKSPTLTMFKSFVFPGWGQFSNGKYIKGVIILAAESYFIYQAVDYGKKAEDWRKKWREAPRELKSEYFEKYAEYRDRRNSNLWYTGLIIFLSMFDAYVDAHLQNFPDDISAAEGLSLNLVPGEESRLLLNYNF